MPPVQGDPAYALRPDTTDVYRCNTYRPMPTESTSDGAYWLSLEIGPFIE
jgi:hypothetical protein